MLLMLPFPRRSAWCFYHRRAPGFQAGAGLVSITVVGEMATGPRRWDDAPTLCHLLSVCWFLVTCHPLVLGKERSSSQTSLVILEKFNLGKLLVEWSWECQAGWDLSFPPVRSVGGCWTAQ